MILVIPFCNKDAILQAKNLEWILELDGKTSRRCMIAWEDGTNPDYVNRIRGLAQKSFAEVHEFPYYEAPIKQWPAAPNHAWQNCAHYIPMYYTKDEPWFWLEADAVPMKKGWLDTLEAEYKKAGMPFMGHIVTEMGHMNGVAVYPNKVYNYCQKPLMVVHSAWDVALKEETIDKTHNANHLIQHCWGLASNDIPQHRGDDPPASFRDTGHMLRIIDPNAVLFHRCKDGSLIDCLHAMQNGKEPHEALIPIQKTKREFYAGETTTASPGPTVQFDIEVPKAFTTGMEDIAAGRVIDMEVALSEPPPGYPKTEIFIVTYAGDAGPRMTNDGKNVDCNFLKYSLYSIRKFARGFTGVTVVCPQESAELIEPICREFGPENTVIEFMEEPEGRGMLAHMAIECMADQYVKNAAYVLHTDADCIFTEPVTPADYFVDGKPVLLIREYESLRIKHPGAYYWKECTEKALKRPCLYETMARHPAVHPIGTYKLVREAVERAQGMKFWDWAISGKNSFPQSWSEYNLIGAVALEEQMDKYHWIDTGATLAPKDKIVQFWSHGGLDRPTDTGPWPGQTPRNIIGRILA